MTVTPGGQDDRQVSERLRSHESLFTKAERKVVRVLNAQYPRAGLESIPTLARRAQVSAPTVLRLINKLGYHGYGDFQAALLEEVNERMSVPAARVEVSRHDDLSGGFAAILGGVTRTGDCLSRTEFAAVADSLATGQGSVSTVGGFDSEFCSLHLANLLSQVRPRVYNLGRSVSVPVFDVLDLSRGDVLIAFDFRRYQSSTVELARRAAERRASVVVVTDRWLSPASEHAEHVLVCDSDGPGPFDSHTAAIALIELLVAKVTSVLGDRATKRIDDVYSLLRGSTWAESLLSDDDGGD